MKSSEDKVTSKRMASEAGRVLRSKEFNMDKTAKSLAGSTLAQSRNHHHHSMGKSHLGLLSRIKMWFKGLFGG